MKTNNLFLIFFFLLGISAGLLVTGCNGDKKQAEPDDGPTWGKINISVDATLESVADSQIRVFEALYDQTKIIPSYKSENEAFADLLNDSARLIFATRDLLPAEKHVFDSLETVATTVHIADDAIALIVNPNNPDSLIDVKKVYDLLEGKITKWNEFSPKSKNSAPVQLVFDNKNSGIVRYFKDRLPSRNIGNKNVYALKTCPEVIEYIKKNVNALGFINCAWIADEHDSLSNSFISSIRIVQVAPADTSQWAGYYYQPSITNIYFGKYPFLQKVYIISREARAGLGTGFAGFVSRDRGQRILLKAGMKPAQMPVRLVELNNESIQ